MKPYLVISTGLHGLILGLMILSTAIMNKPRLAYYAVDVFAGMPDGRTGIAATQSAAAAVEEEPAPPAQKEIPARESIRVKEAPKKKIPVPSAKTAAPAPKAPSISGALRSLTGSPAGGTGGQGTLGMGIGTGGAGGTGFVAEAGGPAFPYPWYLKAITDKLDAQWKPPERFQDNTICQVMFSIARDGRVSGIALKKSSGDSYFDQLAVRAVQNAGPMPPLPSGFPDDILRVHMKFIGKQF